MSDHSLPKVIDPLKYADQNRVLQGVVTLNLMPRLVDLLAEPTGSVEVELEFDRDEQHLRVLKGKLDTVVSLTCQRCLNPVEKQVSSRFELGIVLTDEQAKHLPKHYEPLLVEPDKLVLLDVIEEELILSLPMFAYHESCGDGQLENDESAEAQEKPNPFSVLSELKLKK